MSCIESFMEDFKDRQIGENFSALTPPIGPCVDQIFSDIGLDRPNLLQIIHDAWGAIIAPQYLPYCEPSDVGSSTLWVKTSNPMVRQNLIFEEKNIMEKIRALPECKKIKKLKFK